MPRTETVMVPVKVDHYDFTRSELQDLRSTIRGGNATNDTAKMLRFLADKLVHVHGENKSADYILAARERADMLDRGMRLIDDKLAER